MTLKRHETILTGENTVAVVVDYQERMVEVMQHKDSVTSEIVRILQGMEMLNVPVLATEQYPKGLGPTVSEVKSLLDFDKASEKMTFSCCGIDSFAETLQATGRKQVILMGVETHVCVLQTVLDLLANGYQVHVPIGATCSRKDENRDNAFARMQQAGAILTNTESVLFELMVEAGTETFKQVRKLIV